MSSLRVRTILVVAALSFIIGLGVSSLRLDSATFDEGKHLPVGYVFLKFGDYRFDPDNPPLSRMLAATPLLFMNVYVDRDDQTYRRAQVWAFSHRFLYEWNDADRLVAWGRLPMVVFGAVLAGLVFLWTRTLAGVPAAAAALFLCVLNPDVLAHSRLATTDLPVTAFFFATVAAFERLTVKVTWPRLLLTGLCLGCALASKYSAVALFPVIGVLALVVALGAAPLDVALGRWLGPPRSIATRGGRLATLTALLAGIGIIACVVIWAVYRFRFEPAPAAGAGALDWNALARRGHLLDRLVVMVSNAHLLPRAYLYGFLDMLQRGHEHHSFLMGRTSQEGSWYYFPVCFALKTPIPLLFLVGGALATLRRGARSIRLESFLWLPSAIYGAAAVAHGLNVGHRHLLPVAPFLFVIGGRAAAGLWERRRRAWKAVVLLLAVWYALSTARIHPNELAYFNEIAGGPSNGWKYLVDSNIDWGQDLKRLKTYVDENKVGRILLSYLGSADPEYYGIPCDFLPGRMLPMPRRMTLVVRPGDLVAVSVTNLQGVYLSPSIWPLMERLKTLTPMAVAGYSIHVYRSDFTWILPAEAAQGLGWTALAVDSYSRAIQADPGFVEGYGNLGMAMHLSGRHREAVTFFQQALARDSRYFESRPGRRNAYEASLAAAREGDRGPGP